MKDNFGRNINYLRLSVTDRCDLRCKYCMPIKNQFFLKKKNSYHKMNLELYQIFYLNLELIKSE